MPLLNQALAVFPPFGVRSVILVWLMLSVAVVKAQTGSREYQLKAVFLFNFTQFVQWPTNAFVSSNSPIVIGLLGNDPFEKFLEETVKDEKVEGHPLIVQRFQRVADVKECHLLYISPTASGRNSEILTQLKGRSILTVGETTDFAQSGGMIRFVTENNKIRLRINPDAARQENLTISSKLLRLADIVPDRKE